MLLSLASKLPWDTSCPAVVTVNLEEKGGVELYPLLDTGRREMVVGLDQWSVCVLDPVTVEYSNCKMKVGQCRITSTLTVNLNHYSQCA